MVAGTTAASTLISTKLNPPRLSQDLTPRPRLLDKLRRNLNRKLTLVCAPAGYGKTTLVVSWLHETDRACAWLSLDHSDNNLLVFLRYLVAAVRDVDPGACAGIRDLLYANQTPPDGVLVATLINDLNALQQRLVLVLNDFHLLSDERIAQCLNILVDQLPLQVHLVLISRVDPPLPLHRLRARDMLGEIRAADLRFTVAEASDFFTRTLEKPLAPDELTLLTERTEGWITGLRLASISLRDLGDPAAFVHQFAGEQDAFISGYLLDEVLALQPAEVRSFLVRTAVLDRFSVALCDYVLHPDEDVSKQRGHSRVILNYLESANLFLVSLDPAHNWYRYHHLFQELLQDALRRQFDERAIAALHLRAGTWFLREGQVENAVRHFLAGGDEAAAAAAVEAHIQTALNREERYRVERWLDLLPETLIWQRPHLLVARAWILHGHFRVGEYRPLVDRAEALVQADARQGLAAAADPLLLGQISALRSQLLYFANAFTEAHARAEQALTQLPLANTYPRSVAGFILAVGLQALGRGDRAIDAAEALLRTDTVAPDAVYLRFLLAKAFSLWVEGRLPDLRRVAQQLEQETEAYRQTHRGIDLRLSTAWAYYHLALLDYEQNRLEAAAIRLSRIVSLKYFSHLAVYRDALACLARNNQTRELDAQADAALEELAAFTAEVGGAGHFEVLYATEARLHLQRGDVSAAMAAAARIDGAAPLQPLLAFEAPTITKAQVLIADGSPASLAQAETLLRAAADYTARTNNTRFQIAVIALQALACEARGDIQAALAALERAVLLAEPGGFVRTFVDLGPVAESLLRHLAARGTPGGYLGRLLAAFPEPERLPVDALAEPLTDQEIRVLQLLQSRLSNKEIAGALFISPNTVKRHTLNLYRKLDVNDRHAAVTRAEALGLLAAGAS